MFELILGLSFCQKKPLPAGRVWNLFFREMTSTGAFSPSYKTARERWIKAAQALSNPAGSTLHQLPLRKDDVINDSLPHENGILIGKDGEELSIDVLWIGEEYLQDTGIFLCDTIFFLFLVMGFLLTENSGSRNPKVVLFHSCGVHGVEGYAGSAVQLQAFEFV